MLLKTINILNFHNGNFFSYYKSILKDSVVMYTVLEMVNTLGLITPDKKFISNIFINLCKMTAKKRIIQKYIDIDHTSNKL